MDDFYIDERFSVNANIRACWNCKRYSNKMWTLTTDENLLQRRYRCRKCAFGTNVTIIDSGYIEPYNQTSCLNKNLSWEKPGNIFKCPRGTCERNDLTFDEFYAKICCGSKTETAAEEIKEYNDAKKIDHDFLENILKVHKNLGGLQIQAKSKYDKAKKLFEEAKKELENNETKLKNVEDQMARYFARTSTAITEGKPIEEDPRLLCKICCEKYNEIDRTHCVLPCRHSSCEKCLTALPNKTCPVCREPFTVDQIMKLFN